MKKGIFVSRKMKDQKIPGHHVAAAEPYTKAT